MKKTFQISPLIRSKHVELIDHPVILRVNKFDEETVKLFHDNLIEAQNTGQPVCPVIIDSYGGQIYSLLEIISQIENCKIPVATIVEGKAMSAGAILFGFGQKRYMTKNATLMLHDVSSFLHGKVEEIKADAKEIERLNKLIFTKLAKNLNKKPNYFLDILHQKSHAEWYLTAQEAKKHNICTHIGTPELKIEVSVNYYFN